jgi:hypothetical protein
VQDAHIDHDWTSGEPAPGVPLKTYEATWKGSIRPSASGNYTFLVRGQGGVYVSVGGKNIITSWFCGGDLLSAEVELEAGKSYPIEVTVNYDDKGSPAVQFGWGATPPLLTPEEAERVGTPTPSSPAWASTSCSRARAPTAPTSCPATSRTSSGRSPPSIPGRSSSSTRAAASPPRTGSARCPRSSRPGTRARRAAARSPRSSWAR